jgi:histidinol-phosphate/aromatic aminotransferase/cobyric acid decarboxylase-like protein
VGERPDEVVIPAAGEHGGDGARIAAALGIDPADVLDLSASLNPFAPDVVALAGRHLDALRRYPDVGEAEARVADLVGVEAERLVLTGGSSQAIALLAARLGAGWVDEPDFSLYRRHLPRLDPAAPRWRSDPHSPSGRLAEAETADDAAGAEPAVAGPGVAVWDEAYLPLAAGTWTRHRPAWALGSLTKAFACPGLRLGYAVAPAGPGAADPAGEAEALRRARPAWSVGGLAAALVPDLVAAADPPGWTAAIAAARAELTAVLRAHGLAPEPSDAPWVLVPGVPALRDELARRAVVVRDCTSFGLPGHVRIAVPDADGLARLDAALRHRDAHAR